MNVLLASSGRVVLLLGAWLVCGAAWAGSALTPEPAAKARSEGAAATKKVGAKTPGGKTAAAKKAAPVDAVTQAIQVFRLESARVGARLGAGSNDGKRRAGMPAPSWHGRVYEYVRNNAFDAVPHEVVQRGGERNILRRNQFGVSVSGPVIIPKLYNGGRRTFFTFSYEGTREKVGRSYLRTLPTTPQRSGDFSDLVNKGGRPVTVYDPASTRQNATFDAAQNVSRANLEYLRDPFPNNQIPLSRMDPVALRAGELYPLPNTNVGPFLENNYWTNPAELNAPDGFLSKVDHSLFERHKVTVDMAYSKGFSGQPRIYPTAANPGRPDRDFVDRRLDVRETYAISPNLIYTAEVEARSQMVDALSSASEQDLPGELGLRGVSGRVFPTLRLSGFYGLGASSGSYLRNAWNTYQTTHGLSLRSGRHSWRLSGRVTRYEVNTAELESPSGELSFNRALSGLPGINNTGSGYSTFLLGLAGRAEVTDQPQPSYLRRTVFSTTVGDEIELSETLTATLSLGVDVSTPRVEKFDRQSTVDLSAVNPANAMPGALVFASRDGYGRGFQPTRVRLKPRLGMAWSPTSDRNTVIRGAFYLFYSDIPLRSGAFGTQGFSAVRKPLSPNSQLAPAVTLADGFPDLSYELPLLRGDAANGVDVDLIPATSRQPRYTYFRLDLERRLPGGVTLRVGSRSYRGKNMLIGGQIVGLNRIPLSALQYRDELNNESFRARLRPFPQFQRITTDGQFPGGRYLYDVGDFSVEKRTGQGLSFDVSYQIRRRWDDYSGPGVQDPSDRASAWARTRGNRPRRMSLNYVYELPFGDGKPMLNKSSLLGKIVGDWSVSGLTSWASGDPIQLQPEFNNTGGVVPYLRVSSVPGVDATVADRGPALWFNPAAFAHPDDFSIGDVPRTHPSLRNPSYKNHDLAVTKRVPLSSEQSLELLFQTFNFLNTANWNDPDATIGTVEAPNRNAGRIIGSRGGRVLQLGARYNF